VRAVRKRGGHSRVTHAREPGALSPPFLHDNLDGVTEPGTASLRTSKANTQRRRWRNCIATMLPSLLLTISRDVG
jgi:hypothetical protein